MAKALSLTNVDVELKAAVTKDSSARLVVELQRSQNVLDADTIAELSRSELISYIYYIRKLAGQKTAVRTLVSNFRTEDICFFSEMEEAITPRTPTAKILPATPLDPLSVVLLSLVNMQKDAAEERRLAREASEARDARLEREAAAEKTRLEARDARLEKEAATERTRLEKAAAAETIRLKKADAE